MKLTEKDGEFLMRLCALLNEKGLSIEFRQGEVARIVLRRNYGDRIHKEFGMTRQGVRWRFQRVFGDIYPSAYESILFIESHFGTELRQQAMAIARQQAEWRKKSMNRKELQLCR